jgi:hypothetical protein
MIEVREAAERSRHRHDWLDRRRTFSVADGHDPVAAGFAALCVLNEDRVAPGGGFDGHTHKDVEIITYVLNGTLAHSDDLGTGALIRAGDVQRVSAGTGLRHSEHNASGNEPVHLLQISILPDHRGRRPSYEQKRFADDEKRDRLRLICSQDGRYGSVRIDKDVDLYAARLATDRIIEYWPAEGRRVWLQILAGDVHANGQPLRAGDGAGLVAEPRIKVRALEETELLLVDMA